LPSAEIDVNSFKPLFPSEFKIQIGHIKQENVSGLS